MNRQRAYRVSLLCFVTAALTSAAGQKVRRYIPVTEIRGATRGLPVVVAAPGSSRVYVGAQAALDSEGRLVGKGDVAVQTRQAIENVQKGLAAADAKLEDLVRLDIYVLSSEGVGKVVKVLDETLLTSQAPNQLILPVPELSPPGSLVQICGLAAVSSRSDKAGVSLFTPTSLRNPHGTAQVSIAHGNALLFLSGIPDGAIGSHDATTDMGEITRRSMEGLKIALKAGGASFAEVASSVVYISSLDQLEKVQKVYKSYFPSGHAPPTAYVPRARAESSAGWIEIDMDAVIPQGSTIPNKHEFINPPELTKPTSYTQVLRAAPGETVYVSAQLSAESSDPEVQTQAIYDRLQGMLRAAGAEFKDAVKVRIFPVGDGGRFVRPVRAKFYNLDGPPASTMIRSEGVPLPGADLQIDAIAVVPNN